MEPLLNKKAKGAVFVPLETVAEPWLVPVAYAINAIKNGTDI